MSLKLSFLPQTSTLLMACGMDNSNIQLYVQEDQFVLSETLKGHENWVRGLDFHLEGKAYIFKSFYPNISCMFVTKYCNRFFCLLRVGQ